MKLGRNGSIVDFRQGRVAQKLRDGWKVLEDKPASKKAQKAKPANGDKKKK